MNEVLGALGLAWPRLLIYPGGLGALLGAWLFARWMREPGRHAPPEDPFARIDLLPPLLALTLLPLPPARPFPYGLDLLTTLVLIEWPYWRRLARTGLLAPARLPALLRPYAALLVAIGALTTATGSLELAALTRWPATTAEQLLFVLGMLLWIALLPQLTPAESRAALPMQLRALALVSVPALALIGALAALLNPWVSAAALAWLLPPLALTLTVLAFFGLRQVPQRRQQYIWLASGVAVVSLIVVVGARV